MAHHYTPSGPNTEAEEAVYRHYAPRIFAYLLRRVPSYQDAEDLLMEVFRVVLEKLPTLDHDEQRLGAYIQTIASRKMADYYRKHGNIRQISLEEIAGMIDATDEPDPEQFALAQEQYATLRQAISALSKPQQLILRLRYSHGLEVAEIATQLAKRESAVRMMLSRAVKHLRKLYPMYEKGEK
jgi:RNA polymerase sigma factor (sigma-70 family)